MAYFDNTIGEISWICLKNFDFNSLCSQRSLIDTINILFVCVYYISLIITLIRKSSTNGSHRKCWIFIIVSICCCAISIAFFSIGLWNFIAKTDNSEKLSCIIKGLIWISFAVSLIVQRVKWIRILVSIWWTFSCALVSSLNIEILLRNHAIETFDIVQWLVHFLLLYCAFKNLDYIGNHSVQEGLTEPLLAGKNETKQTGLGHATFLSKLNFSWINSLLSLGYSKPLDLEDIPSLVAEDEADMAYQKFVHAWESLVRERTDRKSVV